MSMNGKLLLWLGCVFMASRQASTEDGLDTNLNNKTLQLIPPNFPSNITKLILSHNFIAMTEADTATLKNYTELTELFLDNNKITVLPGHIFDNLSKLRNLSVSHNNISRVEPKAFTALGKLKKLDLSQNSIQSFPPGVFAGLSSLESLSLQGNSLQSLEKDIFTHLVKLKNIDLGENLWNCSCDFLRLLKNSGVEISTGAVCASPEERAGKSLQDSGLCFPGSTTTQTPLNIKPTAPRMINTPTTAQKRNSQNKVAAPDLNGGPPKQGNTWKFLVGVVVTVICTSMLLVCAIKSPSWYKLMFNYRHQRLREEESNVFTTGRYSNFSLDTEQTETSIQELEVELDNEDGYIEDRYIDAGDYKDAGEA